MDDPNDAVGLLFRMGRSLSPERGVSSAILSLVLLAVPYSAHAQSLTNSSAPTSAATAEELDLAWQRASAGFDETRTRILKEVDSGIAHGPFRADWQSLANDSVPGWFMDAKFGIFIHWGVYAVPAFGSEWYARKMYMPGSPEYQHEISTYGPLTKFGYKDFIPMFRAEKFDPQAWATLFRQAGAKYVVMVFEHHDGFAMYDSALSDWTAVRMGPHRDVAGELAAAVRADGLQFGASSHRVEHDWFMDTGRAVESDVNDPRYAEFYGPAEAHLWEHGSSLLNDWTYVSPQFADDWLARCAEIVEKYHPAIFYFDYWIGQPSIRPYLTRFAAYYYNESQAREFPGIITYKVDDMEPKSAVLDVERGQLSGIRTPAWQTDTSVSNKSWGYINDDTYKTPAAIVHELVDVVSKNGNLLLNVGPRADGTIPEAVRQILLDTGAWLIANGEAIYGTRPCALFAEGPTLTASGALHDTDTQAFTPEDFRFTCKGQALYAIEMAWPTGGTATIHSVGTSLLRGEKIGSVTLLATGEPLRFQQGASGLQIQLPATARGRYAYAFRIVPAAAEPQN